MCVFIHHSKNAVLDLHTSATPGGAVPPGKPSAGADRPLSPRAMATAGARLFVSTAAQQVQQTREDTRAEGRADLIDELVMEYASPRTRRLLQEYSQQHLQARRPRPPVVPVWVSRRSRIVSLRNPRKQLRAVSAHAQVCISHFPETLQTGHACRATARSRSVL